MNLCGRYPGSRQVFRSYSTNTLDMKNYQMSAPMRIATTDHFEQEQTNRESIQENQESANSEKTNRASPLRRRWLTMSEGESKSEHTMNPVKHTKSFSTLKLGREQQDQKKYSFRKFTLFDKKKQSSMNINTEHCEPDGNPQIDETNPAKKIKPLLLRSLSSSCVSLAAKSRPKLISRLSHPDSLTPSDHSTSKSRSKQDTSHPVSWHGPKPENQIPSGQIHTTSVFTRLKDSFKGRHSRDVRKRDSHLLVTRFELELAITKDDRKKLQTLINSGSSNLDAKDYYGKTLLHTACSVGNYHCAQMLLHAGAQIDLQDHAGFTPLHCAVVGNHVPCAAVLIAAGADVMASNRNMHTALTLAHEEEMILLIGRSLLLQGTTPSLQKIGNKDFQCSSLRETKL